MPCYLAIGKLFIYYAKSWQQLEIKNASQVCTGRAREATLTAICLYKRLTKEIKNIYIQTAKAFDSISRPSCIRRLAVPSGTPLASAISASE